MSQFSKRLKQDSEHFWQNAKRLLVRNKLLGFVIIFAVVGGIALVIGTHALSPAISVEPENSTIKGPAEACSDSTASNNGCVQFGGNYNYDFPRTMSYRTISQVSAINCNMNDVAFKTAASSPNVQLSDYTEVTGIGYHGNCNRAKLEQFKRVFPDKLVINYQNAEGFYPQTVSGTWPGYYLMMNRDQLTTIPNATATTFTIGSNCIPINNCPFSVNDYALMYETKGGDPYGTSEYVQISSITGSSNGATITVIRDAEAAHNTGGPLPQGVYSAVGTGTSFTTRPFIAAMDSTHTSSAVGDFEYNLSDMAPVNPANGKRAKDWLADFFVQDFAADNSCQGNASPCPANPTLDGMEFDVSSWWPYAPNVNGAIKNLDCDGDGTIDYCNKNIGTSTQVSSYGLGYENFIHQVKVGVQQYNVPGQQPKMVLGDDGFRALGDTNGAEFESFPPFDNYKTSSAALADLQFFIDNSQPPQISYAFTKDDTPLYNGGTCPPFAPNGAAYSCRNANYRFGLVSSMLVGGLHAYSDEGSFGDFTGWDEDGITDTSTTGLKPGYLGQPIGPAIRQTHYTSGTLVNNFDFETDTNGWSAVKASGSDVATITQDSTTAAPGSGTKSMKATVTGIAADPSPLDIKVQTTLKTSLSANTDYAVSFWAKTSGNTTDGVHEIIVSYDGSGASSQEIKLGPTWRQYFLNVLVPNNVTSPTLSFQVGQEVGNYWFDGVNVYQGNAGILTREFDNGIVVLNDSDVTINNIPLTGGSYRKIHGVQDPTINTGQSVGSTLDTLAAKDGIVLLRN